MSLKNIQKAIDNFKELIETSIIENGAKGKEAMIRSFSSDFKYSRSCKS